MAYSWSLVRTITISLRVECKPFQKQLGDWTLYGPQNLANSWINKNSKFLKNNRTFLHFSSLHRCLYVLDMPYSSAERIKYVWNACLVLSDMLVICRGQNEIESLYFCSLAWTVACTPLSFTLLLQKLSFESLHHRIILHILRFLYCLLNKVQTNTPCEIVASYFCFLSSYQPSRQIISPLQDS